jgi:hypothetical protein
MEYDDILTEIQQALTRLVVQTEDPALKGQMEFLVDAFFKHEIQNFSTEELIQRFGTADLVIRHFKRYLEGQGYDLPL